MKISRQIEYHPESRNNNNDNNGKSETDSAKFPSLFATLQDILSGCRNKTWK